MARGKRVDIVFIKVDGKLVEAKPCTKCNQVKELTAYYKDSGSGGGGRRQSVCKVCILAKNKNPSKVEALLFIEINGEQAEAKKCTKCNEVKVLTEYYSNGRGGKRRDCKVCVRIQAKEYEKKNPEKVAEYRRQSALKAKKERAKNKKPHDVAVVHIEIDGHAVEAKRCASCNVIKALTDFRKTNKGIGGRRRQCKSCMSPTEMSREEFVEANAKRKNKRIREQRIAKKLAKCAETAKAIRPIVVSPEGIAQEGKMCSKCEIIKPLGDYHKHSRNKVRSSCGSCSNSRWKEYAKNNRAKMRLLEKAKEHRRKAIDKALDASISANDIDYIKEIFEGCALTGVAEDIHLDHFIPLSWGHGGSMLENMIPLSSWLNLSKHDNNPFEWIKREEVQQRVDMRKWYELIEYLADLNNMSPQEYEEYVYWCEDNKRDLTKGA